MFRKLFSFMNAFNVLIVMIEVYFIATCVRSIVCVGADVLNILFLVLFVLIFSATIVNLLLDRNRR